MDGEIRRTEYPTGRVGRQMGGSSLLGHRGDIWVVLDEVDDKMPSTKLTNRVSPALSHPLPKVPAVPAPASCPSTALKGILYRLMFGRGM